MSRRAFCIFAENAIPVKRGDRLIVMTLNWYLASADNMPPFLHRIDEVDQPNDATLIT